MLTLRFDFSFITGCRKLRPVIELTRSFHSLIGVAFLGRTTLGERVIREGHVLSAHCLYTTLSTLSTLLSPHPKHNIHAREGKWQLAHEFSRFEPSTWYCTVHQSTDRYVKFCSSSVVWVKLNPQYIVFLRWWWWWYWIWGSHRCDCEEIFWDITSVFL
jgi:hypothetical protein